MEATERPWIRGQVGNNRIYGPDNMGEHSGLIATVHRVRDIDLIVKAVNSHDALLKCAEALRAVIAATQAYLPPDGTSAKDCISAILSATDNPEINAALSILEELGAPPGDVLRMELEDVTSILLSGKFLSLMSTTSPSAQHRQHAFDTMKEARSTIIDLAEALEPFAKIADHLEATTSEAAREQHNRIGMTRWFDVKRARSALSRLKGKTNEG